jgi:hypothetical protein
MEGKKEGTGTGRTGEKEEQVGETSSPFPSPSFDSRVTVEELLPFCILLCHHRLVSGMDRVNKLEVEDELPTPT